MKPQKAGQIVKFHTTYPGEDPNQLYVILEIHFDVEIPRAKIKELNVGKPFASILTVSVDDLEVFEVNTADLVGHKVTINTAKYTQATGNVINIEKQKIMLDLNKTEKGVETNVWVTIQDENGNSHLGTLFYTPINNL